MYLEIFVAAIGLGNVNRVCSLKLQTDMKFFSLF